MCDSVACVWPGEEPQHGREGPSEIGFSPTKLVGSEHTNCTKFTRQATPTQDELEFSLTHIRLAVNLDDIYRPILDHDTIQFLQNL